MILESITAIREAKFNGGFFSYFSGEILLVADGIFIAQVSFDLGQLFDFHTFSIINFARWSKSFGGCFK